MRYSWLVLLPLLVGGCVAHKRNVYFEPQEPGSSPSYPPPHKSTLQIRLGASVATIGGSVTEDHPGTLFVYLEIPQGARVQFASKEVRLKQDASEWALRADWEHSVVYDRIGRLERRAFDDVLPGRSFAGTNLPRTGRHWVGEYTALFVLPTDLNASKPFSIVLPATVDSPPSLVNFTPKRANHWEWVPLQ
ncbi:MAG: hypothetical protein AB1705_12340 [Verrucomicrobiota bacterium]